MRAHLVLSTFVTIGCATIAPAPSAPAPVGTAPTAVRSMPSDFVLHVSGTLATGKERTLTSTKLVHTGDRFHLLVRTTERAELYVAYCDSRRQLSVWPVNGALALAANAEQRVPTTDDFNVDDKTGLESLFIIASLKPLEVSDPALMSALLASKGKPQGCARELGMTTEESRASSNAEASPEVAPSDQKSAPESAAGPAGKVTPGPMASPAAAARKANKAARSPAIEKPDRFPTVPGVRRPRGLFVAPPPGDETATRSDSSGIAIVALTFDHAG